MVSSRVAPTSLPAARAMVDGGAQAATPLAWSLSGPGAFSTWGIAESMTRASPSTRSWKAAQSGHEVDDGGHGLRLLAVQATRGPVDDLADGDVGEAHVIGVEGGIGRLHAGRLGEAARPVGVDGRVDRVDVAGHDDLAVDDGVGAGSTWRRSAPGNVVTWVSLYVSVVPATPFSASAASNQARARASSLIEMRARVRPLAASPRGRPSTAGRPGADRTRPPARRRTTA